MCSPLCTLTLQPAVEKQKNYTAFIVDNVVENANVTDLFFGGLLELFIYLKQSSQVLSLLEAFFSGLSSKKSSIVKCTWLCTVLCYIEGEAKRTWRLK